MEFNLEFHLPDNAPDRRRAQNRVAQRKYRQKRGLQQNAKSQEEPCATSGEVPGSRIRIEPGLLSLASPPWPSGADLPISAAYGQDIVTTGIWDFTGGDGSSSIGFSTSNSSGNPDTVAPLSIDECLIPSQSNSSGASPYTISTISNSSSSSSGFPAPAAGLGQEHAATMPGHVISPTPWLDDQLKHQPEGLASGEDWLRPIHMASQKGNVRILNILARQGIDINDADSNGRTPLIHAVQGGHTEAVAILLAAGAHLDSFDRERRSGLHWAVLHRNRDMLEVLLEHYAQHQEAYGLYIDAYDDAGWTPLHMAIHRGFEAGVTLLIRYGADVRTKAAACPFAQMRAEASKESSSPASAD